MYHRPSASHMLYHVKSGVGRWWRECSQFVGFKLRCRPHGVSHGDLRADVRVSKVQPQVVRSLFVLPCTGPGPRFARSGGSESSVRASVATAFWACACFCCCRCCRRRCACVLNCSQSLCSEVGPRDHNPKATLGFGLLPKCFPDTGCVAA